MDKYSVEYNLLSAQEYIDRAVCHRLKSSDVCITFDDGLYCQYAIADKILEQRGLTVFYFVYTSPMNGVLEKMEVYRSFRNKYKSMEAFYSDFFNYLIELGEKERVDYEAVINTPDARKYFYNLSIVHLMIYYSNILGMKF